MGREKKKTRRILFLIGPEFEDIEFFYPYYRLQEEGYRVEVAGPSREPIQGKKGYKVKPDTTFDQVNPEEYDALVIPGGRGPERIRVYSSVKQIVKRFVEEGKPIAAICHGPQVLISAGVLEGKRATSYWTIRDDVENAGAVWVDEPVVVDSGIVTARHPDDMPEWMKTFISILKEHSST